MQSESRPAEGDLRNLVQARATRGLDPLLAVLNETWLPARLERFNSEFSPRYLGRTGGERVTTVARKLSGFRSRTGALIEFGLGSVMDAALEQEYGQDLRLSFNVVTEFPDFYLRNIEGEPLLRIDAKTLHDESDEYSARFKLPASEIRDLDDLLLYGAWKWGTTRFGGAELGYPMIEEAVMVPAVEIARERDRRTELIGGQFVDGEPKVKGRNGELTPDSNYGKIDRIVHKSRRDAEELSAAVRRFIEFADRHLDKVAATGEEDA